jgi:hypothetical protein
MYHIEVLLIIHQMEDNLEIHMEEVHLEEIHLEDKHLIHVLDHLDGQHLIHKCSYHHGIHHLGEIMVKGAKGTKVKVFSKDYI